MRGLADSYAPDPIELVSHYWDVMLDEDYGDSFDFSIPASEVTADVQTYVSKRLQEILDDGCVVFQDFNTTDEYTLPASAFDKLMNNDVVQGIIVEWAEFYSNQQRINGK